MTPGTNGKQTSGLPIRYVLVLWLTVMSAVAYLDRTNISVAGIEIGQEFAISKIRLGWIFSAFLIGYAGFQIPAGLLARRLGSRRALGPVSYTHLDVYKRQRVVRPLPVAILMAGGAGGAARRRVGVVAARARTAAKTVASELFMRWMAPPATWRIINGVCGGWLDTGNARHVSKDGTYTGEDDDSIYVECGPQDSLEDAGFGGGGRGVLEVQHGGGGEGGRRQGV